MAGLILIRPKTPSDSGSLWRNRTTVARTVDNVVGDDNYHLLN